MAFIIVPYLKQESTGEDRSSVKKIFCGGIKDLTEDELRDYFSTFGPVDRIETFVDKQTNKRKGFAFVTFGDFDAVDKCFCELHICHLIIGWNGINGLP